MNVTYAINIKDLRVVSATCETLKQPDYRKISEETAIAIEKGKIQAKDVAAEILFGKRSAPLPADVKTNTNVRKAEFPKEGEGGDEQTPPPNEPPAGDPPPPEGSTAPDAGGDPAKELEGKTLPELKVIAASKGIKGFNKMDAETITKAILGA